MTSRCLYMYAKGKCGPTLLALFKGVFPPTVLAQFSSYGKSTWNSSHPERSLPMGNLNSLTWEIQMETFPSGNPLKSSHRNHAQGEPHGNLFPWETFSHGKPSFWKCTFGNLNGEILNLHEIFPMRKTKLTWN